MLAVGVLLGAKPSVDPAVAVFDQQLGSRWYGLYRQGVKVGWLESRFSREQWRGQDVLVARGSAVTVVRAGGREHRTGLETIHRFAAEAPHRLLLHDTTSTRGGLTERRRLRAGPGGSGWIAVTQRGREPEQARPTDLGEYTLARFLALERWVAGGPGIGDVVQTARLDPSTFTVRPAEATVTGVTHTVVDGVEATVFSLASFDGDGATVTRYDHQGRILAVEGGEVDLRLEDEAVAEALDAPVDLFLDALVHPRGDLRGAGSSHRVVLEIPAAAAALLPAAAGRLVDVEGSWQIELVRGWGVAVTDPERSAALRVEAASRQRVERLVGQALPKRISDRDATLRLAEFVRDYLVDDRAAEPLDLAAVIDARRGDCTEHAELFVAMARAAGIPAREVAGLMWVERLGAFGGHAWAEVALDGRWIAVDPTWGQVPADPTHLRLAQAPAMQAAARTALAREGVGVIAVEAAP